ncbi:MAG: NAD(P)/FAD-dependent oxidoreductase [Thermaerobacter sp.]|nr:NAD(P)/FAD-dependent oxidoreductase [Thermaerobacter sp.]
MQNNAPIAAQHVYDVAVIGMGPAGAQAAISAWHQGRDVLVLDAGEVSQRKGRAYWTKSVAIEDIPFVAPVTGPKLRAQVQERLRSLAPKETGERGVTLRGAYVLEVARSGKGFAIEASTKPLKDGKIAAQETFLARTLVVATGFEDGWPEIEVDKAGRRMLERYRAVFRYAGNGNGWHLCIRCDGHLHYGQHFVLLGVGEEIYEAALGAQDFTSRLTILTNGRPHGLPPEVARQAEQRDIRIDTRRIARHIGRGALLQGVVFDDGEELLADGFLADEGLEPNTAFLEGFSLQRNADGLLRIGESGEALRPDGTPEPGLYVAGDLVAGARKLIGAAAAAGQDAGLAASDSLRRWHWPEN